MDWTDFAKLLFLYSIAEERTGMSRLLGNNFNGHSAEIILLQLHFFTTVLFLFKHSKMQTDVTRVQLNPNCLDYL